jgi:hypothetical protein
MAKMSCADLGFARKRELTSVVGRLGGRLFSVGDADDDPGNVLAKELTLARGSHREHGEVSKARSVVKL